MEKAELGVAGLFCDSPSQAPSLFFLFLDRIYPQPGFKRLRCHFQYSLRLLASGRAGRSFVDRLSHFPSLRGVRDEHPRFFIKPFRTYLNARWSARQRAAAAYSSLSFIAEELNEGARRAIFVEGNHPLAEIAAGAEHFQLLLTCEDCYEKEGEFTLKLVHQGEWLCALTFSLTGHRRKARVLYIGCLQSHNHPEIKDRIRDATRALHGLRPKALLLLAAQQIAQAWKAQAIVAVGDATHVHESIRFFFQPKRRKQAEYDAFWQESGGRRLGGDYLLPRSFRPRPIDQIKPNKRSLYRARYAMLDSLLPEIGAKSLALVRSGAD